MFLIASTVLLQIGVILADSRIYFPDDDFPSSTSRRNVTPLNSRNAPNLNAEYLMTRSLLKITLDVNRAGQIANQRSFSNFAFGPVTITGVLALLLLGSVGRTFDEIANFMGFDYGFNIEDDNILVHEQLGLMSKKLLTTAIGIDEMITYQTAIFLQNDYPIRREYKEAANYFYQSDIVSLDYRSNPVMAYNYINKWVTDGTRGKITSVLESVPDRATKAIIVGIMYFKGAWEQPFIQGATKLTQFYVNGKSNPSDRKVMMMFNGGTFPYYKDKQLNVEVLGLPYKGLGTTMYVIIPNDSNLNKLRDLEGRLTPHDIQRLVNSTVLTEVILGFPKMKIESTIDLKSIMESLGVQTMFNQYEANFALLSSGAKRGFALGPPPSAPPPIRTTTLTNLHQDLVFSRFHGSCTNTYNYSSRCRRKRTVSQDFLNTLRTEYRKHKSQVSRDNPEIFANQFIHKIFMDINEIGTEAAATSTVSITRSGKVTVRCDVPFLFFIYHEHAQVILFWGSIKSPNPSVLNKK